MPQATGALRAIWGVAPDSALAAIGINWLVDKDFIIRPRHEGYRPNEVEASAIEFLFQEWDYGVHY